MHLNWFISECIFKWHLYRPVNSIKCLLSSYSVLLGCTVNMILQANTAVLSQRWMSAHLLYTRNKALGKRCSLSYSALLFFFPLCQIWLQQSYRFRCNAQAAANVAFTKLKADNTGPQVSHWLLLLSIATKDSDIFPSIKLTSVSPNKHLA